MMDREVRNVDQAEESDKQLAKYKKNHHAKSQFARGSRAKSICCDSNSIRKETATLTHGSAILRLCYPHTET
jgi:hypothetical protein